MLILVYDVMKWNKEMFLVLPTPHFIIWHWHWSKILFYKTQFLTNIKGDKIPINYINYVKVPLITCQYNVTCSSMFTLKYYKITLLLVVRATFETRPERAHFNYGNPIVVIF